VAWDPDEHVGETVTLRGHAWNARAGAMVQLEDKTPIYITGLERWDKAVFNKEVEVTGQLRFRPSRVPKVGPGGEHSHGLGDTYAVDDASWTAVD
jgi:hypothetical protein